MKLVVPLLAVLVIALALGGCRGTAATPQALVPAGASLLGEARVADILKDADLARLYNRASKGESLPETLDDLLALSAKKTGMDLRQVQTILFFADIDEKSEYAGAIAKGAFDESQLMAVLGNHSNREFAPQQYKKHRLLVDASEDPPTAFTLLSKDTLVLGTLPAVQAVVDVAEGDQAALAGGLKESFDALGQPLFRMALEVPPEALSSKDSPLNDLSQVPGGLGGTMPGLEAMRALQVVAMSLDKNGQGIKASANLDFAGADSADEVGSLADGALALMRSFSPNEQMRAVLKKIKIDVAGPRVTVAAQATVAELEALAKNGLPSGF
ncbi:MAG: hypothetical protein FJ316_05125 [SAR202 cluster bacterium]|nr:hypothetical protein [SAR202 cluster bacterium]